jgi:hypothetical protein
MNERIDQLLVKAGAYFGGDGVVYDTFDPKKFAELIVRECTQVLFAEAERLNGLSSEETNLAISDDLESCAEKCMDNIVRIEEHFGVE